MLQKSDYAKAQVVTPKAYTKPTLVKGAVLSAVTALKTVSGAQRKAPLCWVARAAFGETDIRWMIFRAWLIDDAPAWFRSLYLRHGEFGRRVALGSRKPASRRACSDVSGDQSQGARVTKGGGAMPFAASLDCHPVLARHAMDLFDPAYQPRDFAIGL